MEKDGIQRFTRKQSFPLGEKGGIDYVALLPRFDRQNDINDFYSKISDKCEEFCKSKLPSLLSSAECIYRYRLSCTCETSEQGIMVKINITLTDRTNRRALEKYSETHIWQNGMLRKRQRTS